MQSQKLLDAAEISQWHFFLFFFFPADKMYSFGRCFVHTTCLFWPQTYSPHSAEDQSGTLCARKTACKLFRRYLFQVTMWTEVEEKFIMEPIYLSSCGKSFAGQRTTQMKVHRTGYVHTRVTSLPWESDLVIIYLLGYVLGDIKLIRIRIRMFYLSLAGNCCAAVLQFTYTNKMYKIIIIMIIII